MNKDDDLEVKRENLIKGRQVNSMIVENRELYNDEQVKQARINLAYIDKALEQLEERK